MAQGGWNRRVALRDIPSRNTIVLANRGLPHYVTSRVFGRRQRWGRYFFDDAVQNGFIGLIRAAELFDESIGAKFSTYAYYHIWDAIMEGRRGMQTISVPERVITDHPELIPICEFQEVALKAVFYEGSSISEWEHREDLTALLRKLPLVHRRAILDIMDGVSLKETMERDGMNSVQAVSNRRKAAKTILKKWAEKLGVCDVGVPVPASPVPATRGALSTEVAGRLPCLCEHDGEEAPGTSCYHS